LPIHVAIFYTAR